MADQSEQMNMLLRNQTGAAMSPNEMSGAMIGNQTGAAVAQPEIEMITAAQMGLMEMDPEGTKDVVDGLELSKQKVMAGGALNENESSGIMAILQKLGGALSGMMGGGADQPMQQVMVDGNVTMLTAKEIMSAKNAGMLVQPVGEAIRDMEMNQ